MSKMFAAVGMGAGVVDLYNDFSMNWGWSYAAQGGSGDTAFQYYLYDQERPRRFVVPARKSSTAASAPSTCRGHCLGKADETRLLSDVGVLRSCETGTTKCRRRHKSGFGGLAVIAHDLAGFYE